MIILAQRGDQYLVTNSSEEVNPLCKLVDLSTKSYVEMFAQRALKWGYWEKPEFISPEVISEIKRIAE